MKKKVLIISSEPLTVRNVLGSTFELSQAKILGQQYKVAIIATQVRVSFIQNVRSIIKSLFFVRWRDIGNKFGTFFELFKRIVLFRRSWVEYYEIEGVPIYSGNGFRIANIANDREFNEVWLQSAYEAYKIYEKEHGEPDIVHAHGRFMVAGLLALKLKKEKKIRYVYTEHSSRFPSGYVPSESIPLLNEIIDQCSIFIAVSRHLLDKVKETLDRDIVSTRVISNVLDPVYQVSLNKHFSKNEFRFVNIANLEHRKGIDILLRAFKRAFYGHPAYTLALVGSGPSEKDLKELCSYLEIDEVVTFYGEKSKLEIVEILDKSNVFVFPSRFETFGVSVIEAMSRGCPVVATSCGGPEEFVNENCGIIIETENENKLVEALRKICKNFDDYDLSEIRSYSIGKFGSDPFLQSMSQIYNDIIIITKALKSSPVKLD